ncbi:hypothetical protein BH11PAT1_BH11PAT1_5320 [soil metagenome]
MKIKQIKDLFPDIHVARFNVAVWQNADTDSVFFIGREVTTAGILGQPDTGLLKLFEVSRSGELFAEKVIWKPIYDGINLEDPRALALPDENLNIGLTAVLRDKKGNPIPFPAIVRIDSFSSWKDDLPPFLIIDTFGPGKNLTPISKHTYLFRPDTEEYFHKLLVFSVHSQIPKKLGDITFPLNLPWASWRMGTTMPPIWLNHNEALFIIHGISIQTIKGKEKYIYSIGRAKLTRHENDFTVTVAQEPIITPDDFLDPQGMPLVEELHPEMRRVVYSCGGIIKKETPDILSLYVNVGDRTTFEVEFTLASLKKDLF